MTKKEHKVKQLLSTGIEELKQLQNERLDKIEADVKTELDKINNRNKAINGFVMGEVKNLMAQKLYNMELTVDALKELLTEANIISDIELKLAEKRQALHDKREKEAVEQMKENISGSSEAVKEETAPVQGQ